MENSETGSYTYENFTLLDTPVFFAMDPLFPISEARVSQGSGFIPR